MKKLWRWWRNRHPYDPIAAARRVQIGSMHLHPIKKREIL